MATPLRPRRANISYLIHQKQEDSHHEIHIREIYLYVEIYLY